MESLRGDRWWDDGLRSPHDALDGVKLLARQVDNVRAELSGTITHQTRANEAALDDAFFSLLGVPRDVLRDVVRRAWLDCRDRNVEALIDLRESVESEPEITDSRFLERAQASDIDNAVVRWLRETLAISADTTAAINALADRITPD
jgi:hypothetical protein